MKTLTRMDLAEILHEKIGLSRNDSANLLENVLSSISDSLASGESVKLSSFGTFSVRKKSERIGRNPKTGQEVAITPRNVLSFRPSHSLKDRVNQGNKV